MHDLFFYIIPWKNLLFLFQFSYLFTSDYLFKSFLLLPIQDNHIAIAWGMQLRHRHQKQNNLKRIFGILKLVLYFLMKLFISYMHAWLHINECKYMLLDFSYFVLKLVAVFSRAEFAPVRYKNYCFVSMFIMLSRTS